MGGAQDATYAGRAQRGARTREAQRPILHDGALRSDQSKTARIIWLWASNTSKTCINTGPVEMGGQGGRVGITCLPNILAKRMIAPLFWWVSPTPFGIPYRLPVQFYNCGSSLFIICK